MLALVAALFTVAASFHQDDVPGLQRTGIYADHHSADQHAAVSTPLHDCVACRVAHSAATLAAAAHLPGQVPATADAIRLAAVPAPATAATTPSSPRAPPLATLIRL